ncbi:hypothetical protein VNO77_03726 [Canavalia gladiata]|uniref:Uncharacterized protein n=1 Tax=Canavalia gladiata TaxID=3824 RepID=A0AAN9R469_CANGL
MLCEIRGLLVISSILREGTRTSSKEGRRRTLKIKRVLKEAGRGIRFHWLLTIWIRLKAITGKRCRLPLGGVGSSFITTAPGPRSDSNCRTCHSSLGSARKIRRFQWSGIKVADDRHISVDRRSDRFFPRTTRHDPVLSTSRGIGAGARASSGWDARETEDTLFLRVDVPTDPVPDAGRSSHSSCPTEATTWA